ncbi:PAS domain-containing protein [Marinicella gelatinilytica]|uniref:PAS domain-containing protein n=1 Tax=Marinicella gelatinilytica TaxID=2996017 RepID=UPI0022608C91|nr:PAS domain-containing protein [Marinicella gelatinilytica]MCX7546129.1 PAS domain-containing protein [Marinicella gelatinilytica]
MADMKKQDIVGDFKEYTLSLYDGSEKTVYVTEVETPFPEGKLIVSRTDTSGVITHCNDAFVFMSGYQEDELIGQPHSILRHPDIPKAAFKDAWDTINNKQKWNGYIKNLRKDGGFYWTFATIIPNIRNGEIVGYASVRRKPAMNKVEQAKALYQKMLAEEP